MDGMTVRELQEELQSILLADHPLQARQRYAIKSAIEAFEVMRLLGPGFRAALAQMKTATPKES